MTREVVGRCYLFADAALALTKCPDYDCRLWLV